MSLYKIKDSDPVSSVNEHSGIPINADNLLDGKYSREVYIHPSDHWDCMSISPNNAAFKLSFTEPLISFYSCCIVTYKDYGRFMITL